jgi:hypothetical protein
MDVREKLIDILLQKPNKCTFEQLADFLIAHGVTVQEWISVKDGLPEKNRKAVLIALRWEETDIGWYDKDDKCWQSEFINSYDDGDVTHWMPLPQPPKGE